MLTNKLIASKTLKPEYENEFIAQDLQMKKKESDQNHEALFDENSEEFKTIQEDPVLVQTDSRKNVVINLPQPKSLGLLGDILVRIKHKSSFSNTLIWRVCFNTAFTFSQFMKYGIKDLDPVSIRKDERINENFAITLITEPFCK